MTQEGWYLIKQKKTFVEWKLFSGIRESSTDLYIFVPDFWVFHLGVLCVE